jgi:hypothetical protein
MSMQLRKQSKNPRTQAAKKIRASILPAPAALLALLLLSPSCGGDFPKRTSTARIGVQIVDEALLGSRDAPKLVSTTRVDSYPIKVEFLKADGSRDTSFSGWVRVNIKPGNILGLDGPSARGRSVKLEQGIVEGVTARVVGAFGESRIVAEELGYEPTDIKRDPPPQCSDGVDNDGDGKIDFPTDDGCQFADDDSETGGSYSAGISQAIYYTLPRVDNVRGAECTDTSPVVCGGGVATPFKAQAIQIDTGYREGKAPVFDMLVHRISASGFYATDSETDRAEKDRHGYSSVYAFNFSAPPGMRVCDKLTSLGGTANEFFGSIQLSFPTWVVREWDQRKEKCEVPDPQVLLSAALSSNSSKLKLVHSLVRLETTRPGAPQREYLYDPMGNPKCTGQVAACTNRGPDHAFVEHNLSVRVSKNFGEGFPEKNPNYDPCQVLSMNPDPKKQFAYNHSAKGSSCDFNGDGKIDFATDDAPVMCSNKLVTPPGPEKACAAACDADVECTEYSNFLAQASFQFVLRDDVPMMGAKEVKVQADGSAATGFSPLPLRGQTIRSFSGTLGYFSGGAQFTVEARCPADLVLPLKVKDGAGKDVDTGPPPATEFIKDDKNPNNNRWIAPCSPDRIILDENPQ